MDYHYNTNYTSPSDESDQDLSDASDSYEEGFDFNMRLQQCLDNVQHEGTFSTFHTLKAYTNPALHLNGYGSVGLPLAVRDAEAITRICKQSPFGKGDQTIIDTSVRKTWELDAAEFQCRNPAWTAYLDSLVGQAVKDLGVQVETRAQLYKLLLYEEGAFFKAHKDSEKVPGMFGTLVICLPSEHTGGEVYLVHDKKKRTLETAPSSAFDISMLAWYSDVSHEVRPISSGYRLVLTYNLVQDQGMPKQSAGALDEYHARLERLLKTWNRDYRQFEKFIYPLEHQYTKANLSLASLKGHDAAKGRFLQRLCAKNGFYWLLGRMTKQSEDEDYGEESDSLDLDYTVTPTGMDLNLGLLTVEDVEILADVEDLYGNRDVDSEDEGEYMGNESMPAAYRYHDTVWHPCLTISEWQLTHNQVFILMRKESVLRRFRSCETHNVHSLRAFFELLRDDHTPNNETTKLVVDAMRILLTKIVTGLASKANNYDNSYYSYGYLGYGAERERIRADLSRIFSLVASHCYIIGQQDLVREALQRVMQDPSWSSSSELVRIAADCIGREAAIGGADTWSKWYTNLERPSDRNGTD